ncbi:hypothetical protein FIV42_14010 [Persicimonas caeni]|uniref:Caspase family protein n=1 Tax=Persicimonas caeni TaxID=2292766 RepID=A0A4Y6PVQ2_PERCE|nr:hypothetical protein [Persicimonas caeni]QDG51815.1 hypothetical protein FIV42_14010 [Persicimonas caeni]QED33036.1 hypothetical protein FRD00_14005 [Persicimonas caeni]
MKGRGHTPKESRAKARFVALLCALVVASFAAAPALAGENGSSEAEKTRVYALIVANNSSVDEGVKPLKFADDDGARYYELFDSLTDEATLLTTLDADSQKIFPKVVPHTAPPSRAQLKKAVGNLSRTIRANKKKGIESEVYLVFTGHGNVDDTGEGYLSLSDGKLERTELFRDVIEGIDADYTHLIVDACHSYFMVESRGGNDDWKDDRSGESLDGELDAYLSKRSHKAKKTERDSTVGVIVSTSGTAEVHEWSRFRAGVFSHQLRSALLGAADVDQNGDITYAEIEAYLVAANAGVANPRARINVYADPPEQHRARPLVALDDYQNATVLEVPTQTGGRFHLEDARGLRYADFNVDATLATRVVLLHEPVGKRGYYLSTGGKQASVPLDDATVSTTELAFATQSGQSRGAVDEAFRTGLFSVAYGDGFYRGFVAARDKYDAGARQRIRLEPDTPWAFAPSTGYAISPALLDADGPQHHVRFDGLFRHDNGWAVGPFASYGFTPGSDVVGHRAALGVELAHRFATGASYLEPRLRTGYQFVMLADDAQAQGDPLGARGELALAFGWSIGESWQLEVEPGVSLDVVTQTSTDQVSETLYWQPYVGVGVGF